MKKLSFTLLLIATSLTLAACSTSSKDVAAQSECSSLLSKGYNELKISEANSAKGTVNWTAASSLLTAGSTLQGFGNYDGCVAKAKSALKYIEENQKAYQAS